MLFFAEFTVKAHETSTQAGRVCYIVRAESVEDAHKVMSDSGRGPKGFHSVEGPHIEELDASFDSVDVDYYLGHPDAVNWFMTER